MSGCDRDSSAAHKKKSKVMADAIYSLIFF